MNARRARWAEAARRCHVFVERHRPLPSLHSASTNCSIRFRIAASGSRPFAAPRLSATYFTCAVPGIAQVTAGCDTMYFRKNCAHVRAVELPGPVGQRPVAHGLEQPPAAEGEVDEDGHAAVGGERQDAVGGVAVVQRVVHLDDVQRLAAHGLFELGVLPVEGRARADVAGAPRLLPFAKRGQLHLEVPKVVDLDQVDLVGPQASQRLLELGDARLAPLGADLRRDEVGVVGFPVRRRVRPRGFRPGRSPARCRRTRPPPCAKRRSTSSSSARSGASAATS